VSGQAIVRLAQAPFPDWNWLTNARSWDRLLDATVQHVELTVLAVAVGFALAGPLAVLSMRHRRLYGPLVGATGVLFTVPSLAMFMFLGLGLGSFTGFRTAVAGLVLYSLLILLRNTVAGLESVPDDVREAGEAMGHTRRQQLLRVEIPIALPVIFAGLRVATVSTVGLVTITSLIGWGGIGDLILQGWRRQNLTQVLVGVAGCTVLAVVLDALLVGLQRKLLPWSREAPA
jgi:osmoprotectant transport system permease protein